MANENTDLAGAVQWISDTHDEIVDRFLNTRQDVLNQDNGVPSWGTEIDLQVAAYVDGLGELISTPMLRLHIEMFARAMCKRI